MQYPKWIFLVMLYMLSHVTIAQDQEQIDWKTWKQLESALQEEPRPVMLFFEAEWCVYCKKIKREVFTKEKVIQKLNGEYYALKMDVERKDTIHFDGIAFTNKQAITQRNGVHQLPLLLASREGKDFTLPVTILLDEKFNALRRVFKYYTSEELIGFLKTEHAPAVTGGTK